MRTPHRVLFHLLLLLLPTQLGFHFWPSWSMVLGRRVDYLSPTLYFTDILIISILVFWLAEKVYRDWYLVFRTRKKFVFPKMLNTKIQILVLFIIANVYLAASRPVAIYAWIKFFEFFLLGWYIVKTKPRFDRIVFFLSLSVVYSSVIAIAQFFLQHSIGGSLWWLGERTFSAETPGIAQIPLCFPGSSSCPLFLRAYGTFPHPNVLGGFLAITLPLILNLQIYKSTNLQIRRFLTLCLTFGMIALILTFSRSAWVVGALGIGIWYIVFRIKKKFVFPHVPNTKTYILFFVLLFISLLASIVIPQFLGDSESVVVRKQLNKSALSMIVQSPIFGVGLGNFLVELPKFLPIRTVYFLQPVHNIYLLILSEAGVVGVVFFLWLLTKVIKNKQKAISKKKQMLYSPYLLSLISYLLLGLVDHYPLTLQQGQLLFTVLLAEIASLRFGNRIF